VSKALGKQLVPKFVPTEEEKRRQREEERKQDPQKRHAERILKQAERLRSDVETRFREIESQNTHQSLRRELESLKDALTSYSFSQRSSGAAGGSPTHHHHHNHHRCRHHTISRRFEETPSRSQSRSSYERRRPPERADRFNYHHHDYGGGSDSSGGSEFFVEKKIRRDRSGTSRPNLAPRSITPPPVQDDTDWESRPPMFRGRNLVRPRSRSFVRTISVDILQSRRRLSPSPSPQQTSDDDDSGSRRDPRGREWQDRMAKRIAEVDETLRAHCRKEKEEKDRGMRADMEEDAKRRQEKEKRQQKKHEPPKRYVFKPGVGIASESDTSSIKLVDYPEEPTEESHHRRSHRRHHRHGCRKHIRRKRAKSPSLVMYLAGARPVYTSNAAPLYFP